MPLCSVIIPVYNHATLTHQCLGALLLNLPHTFDCEVIVVDDASTDGTGQLLAGYANQVRLVSHSENKGFASACASGANIAAGEYLTFLNNDTIPCAGWLEALVEYAIQHPTAAVVGSKLLYPNDTIQHAGVVICQDGYPRHLYTGFPCDHAAVNRSRRFQIVTGACMLVRRSAFEHAGGFDTAYRNGFEDVDFCLRLGAFGHEVHYCHTSVLYHLESVSEGRFDYNRENIRRYCERWIEQVRADDIEYYLADGLIRVGYGEGYPVALAVSPLLATIEGPEREGQLDKLLTVRSRQVFDLLKDNIRLSLCQK